MEDATDSLRPRVFSRYVSGKNANGDWTAFTPVPAAPPTPTDGYCCTNPALNEGCEHFGVGYYGRLPRSGTIGWWTMARGPW